MKNSELLAAKTVIADSVIEKFLNPQAQKTYSDALCNTRCSGSESGMERAVLTGIVTDNVKIKMNDLDNLFESRKGGPTAVNVTQKEDRVFITFRDGESRNRAKHIIEGTAKGKDLFRNVSEQRIRYPVIIKHVDLSSGEEDALSEIKLRNPQLRENAVSLFVIYRASNSAIGHIKLLLTSKAARDELISQRVIYLYNRACRVTLPDPNREVLRCLTCQRYGHTRKRCESNVACGFCSGSHKTSMCPSENGQSPCCINCKSQGTVGNHPAGHTSCPLQIAAVNRYKQRFDV